MNKIKKKEILIVFIFFLFGMGTMFIYSSHTISNQKTLTKTALGYCIQDLQASDKIINACNDTYSKTISCFLGNSKCDIQDLTNKIKVDNNIKNSAQEQRIKAASDMQKFLDSYKK